MRKAIIAVLFSVVIFMSCSSNESASEPVVYVSGSYADNGQRKACYWINGERHELDGVSADSITAVKGKVYAAGYYKEDEAFKGCYWVDGARYDLPGILFFSLHRDFITGGIFVDKGNVYVSGSTDDGSRYWINGVIQNPPSDGIMCNIFVKNGNVYIPGYYSKGSIVKACYWVNGKRHELSGSDNFVANTVIVENNKVYVAAIPDWILGSIFDETNRTSCYWTDGKQSYFSNLYYAFVVSDGDVFIAYQEGLSKNGEFYKEYNVGSYKTLAVKNGKTYIIDVDNSAYEGYWIDNKFYPLDGVATSIFVE